MFKSLEKAIHWIESVKRFGDKYDLSRMRHAAKMLGHPENTFKSIHIGGTNGKGSTLTVLKSIYQHAGYRVGTYTSPYLVTFNERITIDGEPIDDATLLEEINAMYRFNETYLALHDDHLSFFEMITMMAFCVFKKAQPDIALIEVGLGGLLDATNIITPEAAVITTIGYDHMHVLGNDLESIADNKLGIVKDQKPLITGIEQTTLFERFTTTAKAHETDVVFLKDYPIKNIQLGSPTTFEFDGAQYELALAGRHQVNNAALAVLTAKYLDAKGIFSVSQAALEAGTKAAIWPGRFERFGNVVLDGAHNYNGLVACFDTAKTMFPNKRIVSLFTVMADKAIQSMLEVLHQAETVMFTEVSMPRAIKAKELYRLSTHKDKHMECDLDKALQRVWPGEDTVLVITGSLYFISEMRRRVLYRMESKGEG